MPLYIASLNSGSNGNCYYVGNGVDSVFIDAGISCRETEHRMMRLGLPLRKVRAIFITHEHTDHTRGAEVLSRKYGIPVYITGATFRNSRMNLEHGNTRDFAPFVPVNFGDLQVNPFPKMHDASEPHSFTVSSNGVTAGVFTDIGAGHDSGWLPKRRGHAPASQRSCLDPLQQCSGCVEQHHSGVGPDCHPALESPLALGYAGNHDAAAGELA